MPRSLNAALPSHTNCLHFSVFKRRVRVEVFLRWLFLFFVGWKRISSTRGLRFSHLDPQAFLLHNMPFTFSLCYLMSDTNRMELEKS